jgi:hypothetical protein
MTDGAAKGAKRGSTELGDLPNAPEWGPGMGGHVRERAEPRVPFSPR